MGGIVKRKVAKVMGQTMNIQDANGKFHIITKSTLASNDDTWPLDGSVVDEKRLDGQACKTKFEIQDGKRIYETQTWDNGSKTAILIWEADATTLTLTLECDGVKCFRKYTKQ